MAYRLEDNCPNRPAVMIYLSYTDGSAACRDRITSVMTGFCKRMEVMSWLRKGSNASAALSVSHCRDRNCQFRGDDLYPPTGALPVNRPPRNRAKRHILSAAKPAPNRVPLGTGLAEVLPLPNKDAIFEDNFFSDRYSRAFSKIFLEGGTPIWYKHWYGCGLCLRWPRRSLSRL